MNGYDFSVFTNVSITGIDMSSLDEASLSLLYAQARYCQAMTDADIVTMRELVSEDKVYTHMSGMRQFYEAGVQSTCFISPIFPGITDVIAIIERAKHQCNLVWLENLNLRGDYKARILDWIHIHHPELDGLYHEIYSNGSRDYWIALDERIREYTAKEGMMYIRDDDQHRAPFGEPPVICNYFYHEEITKTAKKARQ